VTQFATACIKTPRCQSGGQRDDLAHWRPAESEVGRSGWGQERRRTGDLFYLVAASQIRLLLIYRKGLKDDLTESEKKVLRELNRNW
jgi:hypothetical protein